MAYAAPWTAAENATLRDMLAKGAGNAAIAAALPGRSERAVVQHLVYLRKRIDGCIAQKREGRRAVQRSRLDGRGQQVVPLANEGLTNHEIAARLGITLSAVKAIIYRARRAGVAILARMPDPATAPPAGEQGTRNLALARAVRSAKAAEARATREAERKAAKEAKVAARAEAKAARAAEIAAAAAARAAKAKAARDVARQAKADAARAAKVRARDAIIALCEEDARRDRERTLAAKAEREREARRIADEAVTGDDLAAMGMRRRPGLSPRDACELVARHLAHVPDEAKDARLFHLVVGVGIDTAAQRLGLPREAVVARWDALTKPLRVPAARRIGGGRWRICQAMPLEVQAALGAALAEQAVHA